MRWLLPVLLLAGCASATPDLSDIDVPWGECRIDSVTGLPENPNCVDPGPLATLWTLEVGSGVGSPEVVHVSTTFRGVRLMPTDVVDSLGVTADDLRAAPAPVVVDGEPEFRATSAEIVVENGVAEVALWVGSFPRGRDGRALPVTVLVTSAGEHDVVTITPVLGELD